MRYYVAVVARSSRVKIEKISPSDLKVWLTAPPVENKANQQLIEVLADYFSVKKAQIEIIAGRTAKKKLVEIL